LTFFSGPNKENAGTESCFKCCVHDAMSVHKCAPRLSIQYKIWAPSCFRHQKVLVYTTATDTVSTHSDSTESVTRHIQAFRTGLHGPLDQFLKPTAATSTSVLPQTNCLFIYSMDSARHSSGDWDDS
jgi:hypothetical protein